MSQSSIVYRISKIKKLKKEILLHQQAMRDGMYQDYYKPALEVDLAETLVLPMK
jgi:hypothetical protein